MEPKARVKPATKRTVRKLPVIEFSKSGSSRTPLKASKVRVLTPSDPDYQLLIETEKPDKPNNPPLIDLTKESQESSKKHLKQSTLELPKLVLPKQTPEKKQKKRTATIKNPVLSPNDSIFNESFGIIQRPEKPIGEVVVRKKDERRKLFGHDCPCCKKYYDSLNLSPESRARRVNDVSRHRNTYRPYKRAKTPEHFWEMDFPSTPECIKRGYWKRNF